MTIQQIVEAIGIAGDVLGVVVLGVGTLYALGTFVVRAIRHSAEDNYRRTRTAMGRSILLGLEILVAADIIRTVAIEPTFESVGVLAGIVLIRTFLSFALEVELYGRWPWQRRTEER